MASFDAVSLMNALHSYFPLPPLRRSFVRYGFFFFSTARSVLTDGLDGLPFTLSFPKVVPPYAAKPHNGALPEVTHFWFSGELL